MPPKVRCSLRRLPRSGCRIAFQRSAWDKPVAQALTIEYIAGPDPVRRGAGVVERGGLENR